MKIEFRNIFSVSDVSTTKKVSVNGVEVRAVKPGVYRHTITGNIIQLHIIFMISNCCELRLCVSSLCETNIYFGNYILLLVYDNLPD